MALHHSGTVVDIHNESGQVITFGVYEAIGIGRSSMGQSQGLAQFESPLQPLHPENGVSGLKGFERQYPDFDAAILVMTEG